MKKEEVQELLRNYRLDRCTKKELEIIDDWYPLFDNNKVEIDLSDAENLTELRKQMHKNILDRINKAEDDIRRNQYQKKPVGKITYFNFQNLKRVSAILLFGVGFAYIFSGERLKEEIALEETTLPSIIYLSDRTVVWLKSESRLEYPKSFTGDIRGIILICEAFFDLAKNKKKFLLFILLISPLVC